MRKKINLLLIIGLLFFFVVEVVGRYMGLNSYPLYIESSKFEYILKPNQNTLIYRNRVFTNEYSMRSKPLTPADTSVVLLIGDSIIHGGNLTDQDSLATTILENDVQQSLKRNVRVLNISAKSWGPDNAIAYLKEFGLFSADLIVLVVSSHDAYDCMTFQKVVGMSADHPATNPTLAWERLLEKGLVRIPFLRDFAKESILSTKTTSLQKKQVFNPGFDSFNIIRKKNNIPLLVYVHSSIEEQQRGSLDNGALKIIKFCNYNHIPIIIGLGKERSQYYEDGLHFNNEGQKFLAKTLYPFIMEKMLPASKQHKAL